MKKAYRTTWGGITSIVAAESRNRAIYLTLMGMDGAGYRCKDQWTKIKALRAPEHDAWAELDGTNSCWDEQNLPKPNVA